MRIEPATCPVCRAAYDPLRARAVTVVDGKVRAYCSSDCLERAKQPHPELPIADEDEDDAAARPRGGAWRRYGFPGVLAASLVAAAVVILGGRLRSPPTAMAALAPLPPRPAPAPALPNAAAATRALAMPVERDIWFHPLPGPRRVLPARGSRRFGAAREGMRPEECVGGHCGVDIGEARGDLVLAAHDGVVERIERDPEVGGRRGNEGRFIRINHKGGTVVTSYMHLDAIREDLKPGIPVKAGEAIGIIGDSGVRNSGPHLHFAVSVRPSADGPELFIDPEPLLHIWPLAPRPAATLRAMSSSAPAHPRTAQAEHGEDL